MDSIIGLLGLGLLLFTSTNIDDIFVLIGFFSDPRYRPRDIVIGQYSGIACLFGASILASLVSLVIPPAWLGLLGLAPIALGLLKLREWNERTSLEEAEAHPRHQARRLRFMEVAAVTMANGGDNLGVYTPLFATRGPVEIALIAGVFVVMIALWCGLAYWLVNHPSLGAPIRRYGHRLVPFVLIGLGLMILHEAGTLQLLWP